MKRCPARSDFFRTFALLCAMPLLAWSGPEELPPSAAYLGQKLPTEIPERFAPAILSAFPFLGRIAFSPDGKECLFTVGDANYATMRLFMTRYAEGAWTPPVVTPFTAGLEHSGEPWFSPDGKRIYFTAMAKDSSCRMDIYCVDRSDLGWGIPIRLPAPINSQAADFCYSQVADGTLYFLSNRSGASQAYRARPQADGSLKAELIPAPVLSVGTYEGDPCVPRDGRFLVFYSGRPGGFGMVDLMASFPDGKGEWTKPINLGADFNTAAEEYGATLSPDGKYLFFVRKTMEKGELFWVSTRAIEKRRHERLASK